MIVTVCSVVVAMHVVVVCAVHVVATTIAAATATAAISPPIYLRGLLQNKTGKFNPI